MKAFWFPAVAVGLLASVAVTQAAVLIAFVWLGVLATSQFRGGPAGTG